VRLLGPLLACAVLLFQVAIAEPAFAQESEPAVDQAASEPIPFREDDVLGRGLLMRVLWVTLFGIVVALAATWFLRRFLHRSLPDHKDQASISLVSFRKLAPRISVFVIDIDGERFAVVDSGSSIVHIPLSGRDDDVPSSPSA
jgi:hypothetical protein